ncbi:hypothetical protein [Streptomyces sp. WG-D5]
MSRICTSKEDSSKPLLTLSAAALSGAVRALVLWLLDRIQWS